MPARGASRDREGRSFGKRGNEKDQKGRQDRALAGKRRDHSSEPAPPHTLGRPSRASHTQRVLQVFGIPEPLVGSEEHPESPFGLRLAIELAAAAGWDVLLWRAAPAAQRRLRASDLQGLTRTEVSESPP